MILTHINNKMPIYKDCTLAECLMVSSAVLLINGTGLSILTRFCFGYGSIGSAITLLSFVHISRFCLGHLQHLKYGKPYGYYLQLFLRKLSQWPLVQIFWQSPCILREGHWSVSRRKHHA